MTKINKILAFTIITAYGAYGLILYFSNKLTFYIHPRYVSFSVLASLFAVGVGLLGIYKVYRHSSKLQFKFKNLDKSLFLALVPVIFGLVLPVKPLSAATAAQRDQNLNVIPVQTISSASFFTSDTQSFTLGDWVITLNSFPEYHKYEGKKVKLDGFVYSSSDYPDNIFLIARFLISCCAVDARPVGLFVEKANWQADLQPDTWVQITGTLKVVEVGVQEELVIVPEQIIPIEVPDNPYIY